MTTPNVRFSRVDSAKFFKTLNKRVTLDISQWWLLLLTIIMGVGMAGVGMNVMHDGNHGSYSSKKWINKIMGHSIYILAGNVYNWQVQHNVLHHTYTNIHGHDEDMDAGRIIRLLFGT